MIVMKSAGLIVVCALAIASAALAQSTESAHPAPTVAGDVGQGAPAARLIKPKGTKPEALHLQEHTHPKAGPIDERCRPLKQQLEGALQHATNSHKAFQARLAHNAGTRLCRVGQTEKGMAELEKGLSYLEAKRSP